MTYNNVSSHFFRPRPLKAAKLKFLANRAIILLPFPSPYRNILVFGVGEYFFFFHTFLLVITHYGGHPLFPKQHLLHNPFFVTWIFFSFSRSLFSSSFIFLVFYSKGSSSTFFTQFYNTYRSGVMPLSDFMDRPRHVDSVEPHPPTETEYEYCLLSSKWFNLEPFYQNPCRRHLHKLLSRNTHYEPDQ